MPAPTGVKSPGLGGSPDKPLDPDAIRPDFPVLRQKIGRRRLVYLDSAGTAQKPQAVIDELVTLYSERYAKINENHALSRQMTEAYEQARAKVARLIHAEPREVVFLRGATEGLSTLGQAFADGLLG